MAKVLFMKNIPLSNNYSNVVHFTPMYTLKEDERSRLDKITREAFFKHYDTNFNESSKYIKYNFNMGDIVTTNINVNIGNDTSLLSCNYLHVIKEVEGELPSGLTEAFYFITNITQYNGKIYKFDLEMDVWTTYDRDTNPISFKTTIFTERKHCNRWSEDFDYIHLYNEYAALPDDIDSHHSASILTNINSIKTTQFSNDEKINKLYFGTTWKYIFVNLNNTYLQQYNPKNKTLEDSKEVSSFIKNQNLNYMIICIPIDCKIKVITNDTTSQSLEGYLYDISEHLKTSAILGIKVTNIPPCSLIKSNITYDTTNNEYNIDISNQSTNEIIKYYRDVDTKYLNPILIIDEVKSLPINFALPITNTSITFIQYKKTKLKNMIYEPKLFTSPYMIQGIQPQYGRCYPYDFYLYGDSAKDSIKMIKDGMCLLNENYETYIYKGSNIVDNEDMAISYSLNNPCDMPYDIDAYKQAMATSRNSMIMGMLTNTSTSLNSTIGNTITNNIPNAIKSGLDIISTPLNYVAKINDLKNTPNTMASNGSSILYFLDKYNLETKYVTYEMPQTEKEIVFDYYYNYGYRLDKMQWYNPTYIRDLNVESIHNLKYNQDIILIRKLFNYFKTNDDSLIEKMNFEAPLPIKQVIASILQKGTKIWTLIKGKSMTDDELLDCFLSEDYENWECDFE